MPNFLTFDLGTTLYKVALFNDQGRLLGLERAIPPIKNPHPQWAEVGSGDFLSALSAATAKLKARVADAWNGIEALSFATQANSFMLTGDEGFHTKIVLWSDQRASSMADELNRVSAIQDFRARTGMPRFSPLLALAKLRWLLKEDPALIKRANQFYFISDFLTHELSQRAVVEAGIAGLSGALDIRTLKWMGEVFRELGIPSSIEMPAVERAGTILGTLEPAAASAFSLPRDCKFVVGCLDQYAGAIGTGTVEPGRMCETTGTVLAAVRCADALADDPPPGVFQGPGFQANRFWQMSFSSTSANLLEWYRNHLPDKPTFESLTELAQSAPPCDLVIEPYDDQGSVEASFRHVGAEHTPGQVVRAIMQRVALSLKEQVEQLSQGHPPTEIRSAGGAARNDYWLQMKANTLGIPFVAMDCEEPTSLGAAMLAASAVNPDDLAELSNRWTRPRARFEPSPSRE